MRKEQDSFGTLEIPQDALYGIQTVRALQNLSFSGKSLRQYPAYIASLAMVKKAAARANERAEVIETSVRQAIEQACDELIAGKHLEHFPVDILHGGGGIGTNMNVNEVISNLANEQAGMPRGTYAPVHPVDHVNASQSTSDACHTAIRMAIVQEYAGLDDLLARMQETWEKLVQRLMPITTIARTCLQDGMCVQLGETFSGYAAVWKRRHRSLKQAVQELLAVNLGGTVIGSGIGAPSAYREAVLAELCHLSGMRLQHRENLFDAAQNLDDLAQVSAQLSLLSTCLLKIAKDLRLLSSGPEAGFAEISLPAVQAGSSFFPGKINPVVPESLIQSCFQVLGCDRVVQATLEHGELDLNVFEGAAGANILDALYMLKNALVLFHEKCLAGIEANEERCEELANTFIPLVVDLKEKHGYSFVSKLIKEKGREGVKSFSRDGGLNDESNK
ncbi:lyase family protein [Brevibacillus nitrificans]|uniref:lyase family protein n=1 Tax=Brevibacillus nitrificans TaxID=651560 RepID=UPI0028586810|nr:lyase family protein [Brevibacillus nitrificans]MDR7319404.1 aspartate ammonia-lyase [Brevibacillus nitrificans]